MPRSAIAVWVPSIALITYLHDEVAGSFRRTSWRCESAIESLKSLAETSDQGAHRRHVASGRVTGDGDPRGVEPVALALLGDPSSDGVALLNLHGVSGFRRERSR